VIQASVHPVAVELDLVQPLRSGRWFLDEFRELRLHEGRKRCGRLVAVSGAA